MMLGMIMKLKTSPDGGNSEVATLLTEMRENVRLPWVRIALLLRYVQQNATWPFEGANSFTEWVALNAGSLGLGKTQLRNYFWMAQYYEEDLRPKLLQWNYAAPPLEELPEHVGPEILADLRKISRAGVADMEKDYAERVMSGTVRCAELRKVWVACRQTIKPDPHRCGRIPTNNYKSGARIRKTGKLFEAEMLTALLVHNGIFTKTGRLVECKVIQNTQGLISGAQFPDFIVACKDEKKGLSLHAIEARLSMKERAPGFANGFQSYFDKVWLAVPEEAATGTVLQQLQNFDGILVVDNGKVNIWQESVTREPKGEDVGLLTRFLLAQELW